MSHCWKSHVTAQISVCVIRLGPLGDDGFKSLNMQLSLQIEKVYSGPFYHLISYSHRTTGCFDDRLLTMMTDTGFYVP